MTQGQRLYVVLDFNASKYYSHHWAYLKNYQDFIEKNNFICEVWVPVNTDTEILINLGATCFPILSSNVYGYEKRDNWIRWALDKVLTLLLNKFNSISRFKESLSSIVSYFYFRKAVNRTKHLISNGYELHFIFPTTDSLCIRFLNFCLKNDFKIAKVSLRLIGVKFKDPLRVDGVEEKLCTFVRQNTKVNFRLGYETKVYGEILRNSQIPEENLYWAPVSSSPNRKKLKTPGDRIHLGFLGTARPNKGIDKIPEILIALKNYKLDFIATVQEAKFSWPEYTETIKLFNKFPENVRLLSAALSDSDFIHEFSSIDFLILPYSPEDYKIAGSGLLFTAADFKIPIFATKGVGFEWDILNFSLGCTFENINQLALQIKETLNNSQLFGFDKYNRARNLAISDFLDI
jgi:hypothetical protein